MSATAGGDPSEELAALAAALAADLRRRAGRGLRRLPAAPRAPSPRPSLGAESGVTELRAQPAASRPAPPSAPSPPSVPPRHAPSAGRAPLATDAADPTEALAAEVRARAAAAPELASLAAQVAACTACGLCRTRRQTVFSDGKARVPLMFVGEAPGADEDAQGLPFVGRAGMLLTDIITKGMGLAREDVYIANVLKCRPPENRDPTPQEKRICSGWLERQIELVDPRVIVALGRHAAGLLLGTESSMSSLRQKVHRRGKRAIVPTYHPAYLLRTPSAKRECWKDIQLAMSELGLTPPAPPSAESDRAR